MFGLAYRVVLVPVHRKAVPESDECFGLHDDPVFSMRERPCCNDGHDVLRRGLLAEIDGQLSVNQAGFAKWRAPRQPRQFGAAKTVETSGIAEQHVEGSVRAHGFSEFRNQVLQAPLGLWRVRMRHSNLVKHPAECMFAISGSNGLVEFQRSFFNPFQTSIMCKRPALAPQLAHERVCVREADFSVCRLADMAKGDQAFERVCLHEVLQFQNHNLPAHHESTYSAAPRRTRCPNRPDAVRFDHPVESGR